MSRAMMAMTTRSSMSVKARRIERGVLMIFPIRGSCSNGRGESVTNPRSYRRRLDRAG